MAPSELTVFNITNKFSGSSRACHCDKHYTHDKTNPYMMVYETVVRLPLIVRQPISGGTRPSQEIEM
jgi:hypothetical protein